MVIYLRLSKITVFNYLNFQYLEISFLQGQNTTTSVTNSSTTRVKNKMPDSTVNPVKAKNVAKEIKTKVLKTTQNFSNFCRNNGVGVEGWGKNDNRNRFAKVGEAEVRYMVWFIKNKLMYLQKYRKYTRNSCKFITQKRKAWLIYRLQFIYFSLTLSTC